MALASKCMTPGAMYRTTIQARGVVMSVTLPFKLDLSEAEAKQLEINLHNGLELVLSSYFAKRDKANGG